MASLVVEANVGDDGFAIADLSDEELNDLIAEALAEAGEAGAELEIVVSLAEEADVEVVLPGEALADAAAEGIWMLRIDIGGAVLEFDRQAMRSIAGNDGKPVHIRLALPDSADVPEDIASHLPQIRIDIEQGEAALTGMEGQLTVTLPMEPEADTDKHAYVVYHVDGGAVRIVVNGFYDPEKESFVFRTDKPSVYVVGYNKMTFDDVPADAWYEDAVTFASARGIVSGTGKQVFSPGAPLTRAQFLVMVMNAFGIEPDDGGAANFDDAGDTYYTGYLSAAKERGLTEGVGGNRFAPDRRITRQEMFVFLYNLLANMDQLPEGRGGKSLADFTDADAVAPWAEEAIGRLAEAGIVAGDDGRLLPEAESTRAQGVQLLLTLFANR